MRLRSAHIVLLLILLATLAGCGRRGRVIPEKKLMKLYTEMYLADQWLRDHPDVRKMSDTTLFFDPIFRRHGYTFEDYDHTVQYYLDHSERYVKILNRVETQLRKEGESLQLEADRQTAREVELNKYRRAFRRKDFSTDSLRWAGIQPLWPVDTLPAPVDTLPAPADTLAQRDTLDKAERLEPTRPEKALRRLDRPIKEITD